MRLSLMSALIISLAATLIDFLFLIRILSMKPARV